MQQKFLDQVKSSSVDDYWFSQYQDIILQNVDRQHDASTYTEKHHILPKCLGGLDEPYNMIILTGSDHLKAHYYLYKCTNSRKLAFAFNQMRRIIKKDKHTLNTTELDIVCRWFEDARIVLSKAFSEMQKDIYANLTDSQKEKRRENTRRATTGKVSVYHKETGVGMRINCCEFDPEIYDYCVTGTTKSDETKKIMSEKSSSDYKGLVYHHSQTSEIRYFKEPPEHGLWIRGSGVINRHTKGTVFYHNPETKEQIRTVPGEQPEGWVSGRATFNNPFKNSSIRTHILTGEVLTHPDKITPLYGPATSKFVYTYTDWNGNKKFTANKTTMGLDVGLNYALLEKILQTPNYVISTRVTCLHAKQHIGKRFNDILNIVVYKKTDLTEDIVDEFQSTRTWLQ